MFVWSARCGAPCIRVEFTNVKQSNKGEGGRSRGGGAQNNISGQFPAPVTTPGHEVEMLKIGNGDINQLLTIIHG